MRQYFIDKILPALLVTLVLSLIPILSGAFKRDWFIHLIGGVSQGDMDHVRLENRHYQFLGADIDPPKGSNQVRIYGSPSDTTTNTQTWKIHVTSGE